MRIRLGVPRDANRDEKEAILNSALESVVAADEALIARGLPLFRDALPRVRWRPEPPGDEHFDLGSTVLRRGWGDCDDLAPWHAASLRASGEDPEAFAFVRPSGPNRWHAIVQRSDGSIDDPSKAAGMGSVSGEEIYGGPFWPTMFGDRMSLAALPMARGWGARVDVPSAEAPFAYSALARGLTPRAAVVGACVGALEVCGEDADDDDLLRLAGLQDLLTGASPDDVAAALDQEEVGLFGAVLPAAMSLASPMLKKILPGGGGGGGGGAPAPGPGGMPSGTTLQMPGGPIFVRF